MQINQHLVYQNSLADGATLKPYQTVALTLPALMDDHLASGGRYHRLPYEITNTGMYKFCIPDDDAHLEQVELLDLSGSLLANWKKGEPCASVPLTPGKYTLHTHLAASDWEPQVFMKPHSVSYTRNMTGKRNGKVTASSFDEQVPMDQFKNLKVDSLSQILLMNRVSGIDSEGWGVTTSNSPKDTASYHTLNRLPYFPQWRNSTANSEWSSTVAATKLQLQNLIQFIDTDNQSYFLRIGLQTSTSQIQGDVGVSQNRCNYFVNKGGCAYSTNVLGLLPSQSSDTNDSFRLTSISTDNTSFNLMDTLMNQTVSWQSENWIVDSKYSPVQFKVKVRYGMLSKPDLLPPMLANEVALFDQTYEQSGFPTGTHYWIINADAKIFSDFAFNDPTNRIRTVIAGRGVRAHLFQKPNFQGKSMYVSPPADSEMVMTATDHPLLEAGTVSSVRLEPNSNDMTAVSFEFHTVISSHSCIGCDLRGFDGTSLSTKATSGVNFSDSDLSFAIFAQPIGGNGTISNSFFKNVAFNNAGLANDRFVATDFSKATFTGTQLSKVLFGSCNFTGTRFSSALMHGVQFSFDSKIAASGSAFYNACPKFENIDLTSVTGFDSYFPVENGSYYNAESWWQKPCRVSLRGSTVSVGLFKDKRLWQFVDAPGVDFSKMTLDGAVFAGSNLAKAKFTNASLKGAVFTEAYLAGADFTNADLTGAHFEGATLQNLDKNGAVIDQVALYKANSLSGAFLSGVTLSSPNLTGLDMSGAVLKEGSYTNWDGHVFPAGDGSSYNPAVLDGAYMFDTKLNGADLSGASLQGVSWFGDLATGENATMEGTYFSDADMPGLNLKSAHLKGANFSNCVLVKADLSVDSGLDYNFAGTNFYNANLKGANLNGANLSGAILDGAFVYSGKDSTSTIVEVLDDPAKNPGHYRFFSQAYGKTSAPASTDGIMSCPNGSTSPAKNCGELTDVYWIRKGGPLDPVDCITRPAQPGETGDDQGNVLVCTSQRHIK